MSLTLTPTIKPTIKQDRCYQYLFDDVTRYPSFGGGAGGGKSWLGCEWEMLNCYRYPESKWFIARKELKRLMGSTYLTFQKVLRFYGIPLDSWHLDGKYNVLTCLQTGSKIDLLDANYLPSDPMFERFGSLEYTGGWIEEAGEVNFAAFDTLKSRVGRHLNEEYGLLPKLFLTMNPTKNWLYRVFYKPWRDGKLPKGYSFVQSLYNDNPFTASAYGKQLSSIKDPVTRARLRDGIWEYSDEDTVLIEYDAIIDLFTNTAELSSQRFISCDAARFGSDRIVIGVWHGLNLVKIVIKQKQGIDVTISDLRSLASENAVPYSHVVVDEDGVGGGIVDGMKGIKGFVNNSTPIKTPLAVDVTSFKKENYRNLKTQCSYLLADKINNHQLAVTAKLREKNKDLLVEELQQIKKKITADFTTLQIASKEDVKEALGRSPDLADMMVMRMYFELEKPKVNRYRAEQGFGGIPLGV